ncbi:MAG: hypothetical protein ACR2F2_06955 [Pyrinomonadaceae bacterium]
MKKLLILFLFVIFVVSCTAQKADTNLVWKNYDFSDAGIKISIPCDPNKSVKVFQEKPKLAQVYQFTCKTDNIEFSISLAEHFGAFEPSKTKDALDGVEKTMREGVKDSAKILTKDFFFRTLAAKQIDVKNETTIGRHLHIQHERGAYNIQLIVKRKPNQSSEDLKVEFDSVASEYFDSLKVSENK